MPRTMLLLLVQATYIFAAAYTLVRYVTFENAVNPVELQEIEIYAWGQCCTNNLARGKYAECKTPLVGWAGCSAINDGIITCNNNQATTYKAAPQTSTIVIDLGAEYSLGVVRVYSGVSLSQRRMYFRKAANSSVYDTMATASTNSYLNWNCDSSTGCQPSSFFCNVTLKTKTVTKTLTLSNTHQETISRSLVTTFSPSFSKTKTMSLSRTGSMVETKTRSDIRSLTLTLPLTPEPTLQPTLDPTFAPTFLPTLVPTLEPSSAPTAEPSLAPTFQPSFAPTAEPSFAPTTAPTLQPTAIPTIDPTAAPTLEPTAAPTFEPTAAPTLEPTKAPTLAPTVAPTSAPTFGPTIPATDAPTPNPTLGPTNEPTIPPTEVPTLAPTCPPIQNVTAMLHSITAASVPTTVHTLVGADNISTLPAFQFVIATARPVPAYSTVAAGEMLSFSLVQFDEEGDTEQQQSQGNNVGSNPNGFSAHWPELKLLARLTRVNESTFRVELPVLSSYHIVEREGLQVGVAPIGFFYSFSNESSCPAYDPQHVPSSIHLVTIIVEPPPLSKAIVQAMQATQAITSMALSGGAVGGAAPAAADAQVLAVVGYMSCARPLQKKVTRNARLLAPAAISNSFVGIATGGILVVLGVFLLHGIVVVSVYKCAPLRVFERDGHIQSIEEKATEDLWSHLAVDEAAPNLKRIMNADNKATQRTWSRAMAIARFPNLTFSAAVLSFQGLAVSGINALAEGNAVSVIVGLLAMVVVCVIPAVVYWYAAAQFVGQYRTYQFNQPLTEQSEEPPKVAQSSAATIPKWVSYCFLPTGQWYNSDSRRHAGHCITNLRLQQRFWVTLGLWAPAISVLGSVWQPSTQEGCAAQFTFIALTQLAAGILVFWVQPFRSRLTNFLSSISSVSLCLAISGSAVAAVANPDDKTGERLNIVGIQLVLGLTAVRILEGGIRFLVEHFFLRKYFTSYQFHWAPKKKTKVEGTLSTAFLMNAEDIEEVNAERGGADINSEDEKLLFGDASNANEIADEDIASPADDEEVDDDLAFLDEPAPNADESEAARAYREAQAHSYLDVNKGVVDVANRNSPVADDSKRRKAKKNFSVLIGEDSAAVRRSSKKMGNLSSLVNNFDDEEDSDIDAL